MENIYRRLGNDESIKLLWQNKEALEMYIAKLKDFWDDENQCWREPPKTESDVKQKDAAP